MYKYEVLGGQDTSIACAQLNKKYPENPLYRSILTEVYVGLSDDEALHLASRHNCIVRGSDGQLISKSCCHIAYPVYRMSGE